MCQPGVAARECIIVSRILHRSARIRTSAVTGPNTPRYRQRRHTSRGPERAALLIECNYDERRAQHVEKLTRYFLIIRFNSLRSCVSEAPARSSPKSSLIEEIIRRPSRNSLRLFYRGTSFLRFFSSFSLGQEDSSLYVSRIGENSRQSSPNRIWYFRFTISGTRYARRRW